MKIPVTKKHIEIEGVRGHPNLCMLAVALRDAGVVPVTEELDVEPSIAGGTVTVYIDGYRPIYVTSDNYVNLAEVLADWDLEEINPPPFEINFPDSLDSYVESNELW